jgi:SAM-dependent methyltransferase
MGSLSVVAGAEIRGDEVVRGTVACAGCGRRYPVENGLAFLHVETGDWSGRSREATGWVDLHKELGIYDQTGTEIDFVLPFCPNDPWPGVAHSFQVGLQLLKLMPGERVLDIGAGRGWASKYFALRGCRAVAVEIVPDDQVGLGRMRTICERAGTFCEGVIADFCHLPFADESFDAVFACGSLHHSESLAQLTSSIARVLKPSGRLVAVNEPCIAEHEDEAKLVQEHASRELSHGIVERRPKLSEYKACLSGAGFAAVEILPCQAYGMDESRIIRWARELRVTLRTAKPGAWARRLLPSGSRVRQESARRLRLTAGEVILSRLGGEAVIRACKQTVRRGAPAITAYPARIRPDHGSFEAVTLIPSAAGDWYWTSASLRGPTARVPANRDVEVSLHLGGYFPPQVSPRLRVTASGRAVFEGVLSGQDLHDGKVVGPVRVPASLHRGDLDMKWEVETWKPSEVGVNPQDHRELGLDVVCIEMKLV